MNYTQNAYNNRKAMFSRIWLIMWRKTVLLIFTLYHGWLKKSCLNKSKFSSRFAPFQTWQEKKLAEYFSACFCDSHFYVKRKVLYEFTPKCFKTTERHSLAVCDLLCVEKEFLFIFIPFYWFNQKQLFKQIQIFFRFASIKHGRKN